MRTILSSKQQFLSLAVSVLLSVFMVAVVAYGATITISNRGVGSGTSTPGAALGVSGAALVDDFVWANAFIATSSNQRSGIGTTSPGAAFAVRGAVLVEDFVWTGGLVATSTNQAFGFGTSSPGTDFAVAGAALFDGQVTGSFFNATSTTATSTLRFGMTVATTSIIDGYSGRIAIGTTTIPDGDIMLRTGGNPDPGLTISGIGNSAGATGTLYVAGGGASGGEIIIKSGDGNNCVSMVATTGASDPDTAAQLFANLLTVRVVACPK